jgi:formylglycine-generating enzyme required for sulfatase activity
MPTKWLAARRSLFVAQRCKKPANVSEPSNTAIVASLCGLLTLTGSGCIGATAAQEVVGQDQLAPTVLTFSEEKMKAATPGTEFKECTRGCPMMIVISPGKFVMGSSVRELDHRASEDPQHEVGIAKSFAISKFEVTFEQWDACVGASACVPAADAWGRGNMPVVNVSWEDVHQYVAWLSRLTGKEYRLLTEAEWEYAARAGTNTRFSWGNEPGAANANCSDCGSTWSLQTAPVGSFKPNAFGLHDVLGNVWEWVEDSWHENYQGAPRDGSAWLKDGNPNYRVIRGGSWHNESELIRVAARFQRNHLVRFDTLGFRVARTMTP